MLLEPRQELRIGIRGTQYRFSHGPFLGRPARRENSGDTIPIFSWAFPWSACAAGHETARQLLFEPGEFGGTQYRFLIALSLVGLRGGARDGATDASRAAPGTANGTTAGPSALAPRQPQDMLGGPWCQVRTAVPSFRFQVPSDFACSRACPPLAGTRRERNAATGADNGVRAAGQENRRD